MDHHRRHSSSSSSSSKKRRRHHSSDDEEDVDDRKRRRLEKKLKHLSEEVQQKKERTGGELITEDDFYRKSNEFRVWLLSRNKYFDELSKKKSQRYFRKFVKKWNRGELDSKIYQGIHSTDLSSRDRTKYQWNFKNVDSFELDLARDSVDTSTYSKSWEDGKRKMLKKDHKNHASSSSYDRRHDGEDADDDRDAMSNADRILDREERDKRRKEDDKRYAKRRKEDLDEMAPKPDAGSFEARLMKRKEVREKLHGSRDDDDVIDPYANDSENIQFRRELNKEKREKQRRQDEMDAKIRDYEEKERQKLEQFRPALARFQASSSRSHQQY